MAALLPVVVVMAVCLRRPTSQLLMPMVFGAHCGSMLALTGTPVNVLVNEAALDAGRDGFGYFEYAYAGVPLLLGASPSPSSLASAFCPCARASHCRLTSAPTPAPWSSSSA